MSGAYCRPLTSGRSGSMTVARLMAAETTQDDALVVALQVKNEIATGEIHPTPILVCFEGSAARQPHLTGTPPDRAASPGRHSHLTKTYGTVQQN